MALRKDWAKEYDRTGAWPSDETVRAHRAERERSASGGGGCRFAVGAFGLMCVFAVIAALVLFVRFVWRF